MTTKWTLVIDQERCIGCEACTVACRVENLGKRAWIRVETQGGGEKDTPKGRFPGLVMHFLPILCQHCNAPPCADACPAGALEKKEEGAVVLNSDLCDGCGLCVEACPYGALAQPEPGSPVEKCHFCLHRVGRGQDPFCALCCEGRAISFGDRSDPRSPVTRLVSDPRAYQLKAGAGTSPSVWYLRPRPPRGL